MSVEADIDTGHQRRCRICSSTAFANWRHEHIPVVAGEGPPPTTCRGGLGATKHESPPATRGWRAFARHDVNRFAALSQRLWACARHDVPCVRVANSETQYQPTGGGRKELPLLLPEGVGGRGCPGLNRDTWNSPTVPSPQPPPARGGGVFALASSIPCKASQRAAPRVRSRPAPPDHHAVHRRCHADAGARPDHRQCRAALHAGQPVGDLRRDHLGPDQLHHRRSDHDRAGRLAGRALRPQIPVHHLPDRLHHHLDDVRCRAVADADGGVPPAARHVRRRTGAAVAGDDDGHLPDGAARPGDGDLGRRRHGRPDHRPHPRRLPDRDVQLALRLLHQPAVRHPRHARPAVFHAALASQLQHAVRLDRLRACCRWASAGCR